MTVRITAICMPPRARHRAVAGVRNYGSGGQACWSPATGVPGSQHRAGGSAAVQRGERRGADAGVADRTGGRVGGDWGSLPRALGLSGVGSSRRPGPRLVLDAWVGVAAVVLLAGKDSCARWCRAPGPRDRGSVLTGGMVAAVGGVPGPPGLGGNDHGGFRSQFGQQVFEN